MANGNVEELILRIVGDSKSGEEAIKRVQKVWSDLGRTLRTAKSEIAFAAGQVSKAGDEAAKTEPKVKQLAKSSETLKQKLNEAGKAGQFLGVVFGSLAALGGKVIQSTARVAMRNEVLALSLYTVGENAGYSRSELDILTDQVKDLGITTSEARLGLTRMMQGELDLAQATDLARTAQNLAVIAGENSSETFGTMLEAVVSLQPRMLRQYGIVTTLNQAIGDLSNSTDAAAKRAAFLDYVLNEGAKSAGVYESAMTVVGKKITSIPRLVEEAKAAFGKHFIPIVGVGVDVLSKLLKIFESLPPGVQKALAMILLIGTALSALMAAGGGLLAVLPMIVAGFSALSGIAPVLLPILAALAALLSGVGAAVGLLYVAWTQNWGTIRSTVVETWAEIQPYLAQFISLARAWGAEIVTQARVIWGTIQNMLVPIFARLSSIIRSIDWAGAFGSLMDVLNVVGNGIKSWLETINRLLRGEGFRAFSSLEDVAIDGLTLVALVFDKYIKKAAVWGWNLIVQFANGMMRAAQTVLTSVMRAIGNAIGRFIAPGSPPKEGPLSNIVRWGTGLLDTFLRAFGKADFGLLRDSLAPIKDALENAFAAGDISEPGFLKLFKNVRTQVAGLIANFRKTGEISEEALGNIAASLGPGSEELVEFLRLQLKYQQATEKLKTVQDEVAAAEAKGFVPAELKAKLKAAEEEAELAKEKVDWQKEYLDAQKEGADLQIRLIEALEKLAEAGGGAAAAAGGGGAGGLGDLGLGGGFGELDFGEMEGLDEIEISLGEMTPEFEEMRQKVLAWYNSFKAWLALPIDQKIGTLAQKLTEITGIDFAGFWADVQAAWQAIEQNGLVQTIWTIFQSAWENVYSQSLAKINEIVAGWLAEIILKFTEWSEPIRAELSNIVNTVWPQIKAEVLEYLRSLFADMGLDFDEMVARWQQIWEDAKQVGAELWAQIKEEISRIVGELRDVLGPIWEEIKEKAAELWQKAYEAISEKVQEIYDEVTGKIEEARSWIEEQVEKWKEVGKALIEGIKQGVLSKVGELIEAATSAVEQALDAAKSLLGISSPSSVAGKEVGAPISQGIAEHITRNAGLVTRAMQSLTDSMFGGINLSPVMRALQIELGQAQRVLASGDTVINQQFGDMVYPNVSSGWDALDVRRALEREALRSSMAAKAGMGGW